MYLVAGSYMGDSVYDFYSNHLETAMLSKLGFGTSSYMGDIRGRGEPISSGGEASGVVPQFDSSIDVQNKVSQGNNRRGQKVLHSFLYLILILMNLIVMY